MPETSPAAGPWKVLIGNKNKFWVIAPPAPRMVPLQQPCPIYVAKCDELVDAAFIADACNFHDRLTDALRQLMADLPADADSVKNAQWVLSQLKKDAATSARWVNAYLKTTPEWRALTEKTPRKRRQPSNQRKERSNAKQRV